MSVVWAILIHACVSACWSSQTIASAPYCTKLCLPNALESYQYSVNGHLEDDINKQKRAKGATE